MIDVENFFFDSNSLTIQFNHDGVYKELHFPIDTFEKFCVANGMLEWHDYRKHFDGDVDEREGVWDFVAWCNDKLTDKEIILFLKAQLKLS